MPASIQKRFSRVSKLWSPSPHPSLSSAPATTEKTAETSKKATPAKTGEEVPWIVEDRPVDGARPIRVVIIGSGLSGIIASIRFRQRIQNLSLTVYEKNEDIGGTWYENRYPGCACGRFLYCLRLLSSLIKLISRYSCTHLSSHV